MISPAAACSLFSLIPSHGTRKLQQCYSNQMLHITYFYDQPPNFYKQKHKRKLKDWQISGDVCIIWALLLLLINQKPPVRKWARGRVWAILVTGPFDLQPNSDISHYHLPLCLVYMTHNCNARKGWIKYVQDIFWLVFTSYLELSGIQ